jgi:hypothetical protein
MAMIAEVAEAQAEGRVVAIYADIRQVLGVPFVNLIYRHLATAPAVLDCVWAALRPHFASGELAAQAARLRREVAALVEGWPVEHMGNSPGGALEAAAGLVGMYNEANSLNRVALQHLLGSNGVQAAVPQAGPVPAAGPADFMERAARQGDRPAIPRLPEFWELHQREVDRIHRLNAYAEPGTPAMVASLYRHLAAWPGVLHEVELVLTPLNERGLLGRAREDTCTAAARCAQARPLPMGPLVDAFHSQFEARLRQFADVTISKMIPIGMALSRAFGPPRNCPEQ